MGLMTRQRPFDIKQIVNSGTFTEDLPRGGIIRGWWLHWSGVLTVTSDGTAIPESSPEGLITQIELLRNNDPIVTISGDSLRSLQHPLYNQPATARVQPSGFTAAGGPYAFSSALYLPRERIYGVNRFDTVLDARGLTKLTLRLSIGPAVGNLITGGAATFTLDLRIHPIVQDVEPGSRNKQIDNSDRLPQEIVTLGPSDIINSASAPRRIIGPLEPGKYEWMLLRAKDNGIADDDIINLLEIRGQDFQRGIDFKNREGDWNDLRDQGKQIGRLTGTQRTGDLWVPFDYEGRLSRIMDIRGSTDGEIAISNNAPTGASTLEVVQGMILPMSRWARRN